MRLAIALALVVLGLLLLPTLALPVGLLLCAGGWWAYERSSIGGRDDALITVLMIFGGLGVAAVFIEFVLQRT